MTEAAAPVGARLKAERERRGLSSQKAADELHLDGWVIDALEAEDYLRVGPSVYAKGHLKRYAGLLGLPDAEIMAGYESRAQMPNQPVSQPANVRLRTDTPAVSNLPWPQIVGSVAVVLLVLGVLWWKPWHQRGAAPANNNPVAANPIAPASDNGGAGAGVSPGSSPSPGSGPGEAAGAGGGSSTASTTTSPSPPSLAASPGPAAAGTNASPAGAAAAPAVSAQGADAMAGAGRAHLRLSFSADSWVDVHDAAGGRLFAGKGRANSVKTLAGVAPMRVYLGFASGVQLEINNRAVAIGPQFVAGDVARFEAGADGILRRDSRSSAVPGAQARNARPTG